MVALIDVRTAEIRADDAPIEPPADPEAVAAEADAVGLCLPDSCLPGGDGDVAELLRERCAAVIDAEVTRLARRTSLGDDEMAAVTGALHRLADALLLERVRAARCEPLLVAALFDLERTC